MLAGTAEMNSAEFSMLSAPQGTEVFQDHPFLCGCSGCHGDQDEIADFNPSWIGSSANLSGTDILSGLVGLAGDILSGPGNFDYTIDIVDAVGSLTNEALSAFYDVVDAAMKTWAYFLDGVDGASLEVSVSVGGTSAVASAGPAGLFFGDIIDGNNSGIIDDGDFRVVQAGSMIELTTGVDLTSGADIVIFVDDGLLLNNGFFFDPTLSEIVPGGKTDLFSVLLHEIGHGLGFLGINNKPGEFLSANFSLGGGVTANLNYGTLLDFYTSKGADGVTRYWGPNASEAYGDGIPIEFGTGSGGSDLSHWLGTSLNGEKSDLRYSLMNPFTVGGDRVDIGNLELLLMQDLGYTVVNWAETFTNYRDGTSIRTVTVGSEIRVSGTSIAFDLLLDDVFNAAGASGSVGFEIQGQNGNWVSGRALFLRNDTGAVIELDGSALFGANLENFDGSLNVRLFNPANVALENGALSLDATIGTAAPPPEPEPEPETPGALIGTQQADTLIGSSDADTIEGKGGNDVLFGGNGRDVLLGGNGRDVLYGEGGHDVLYGEGGHDELVGGRGNDLYTGSRGADTFRVGEMIDAITDLTFGDGDKLEIDRSFLKLGSSNAGELQLLADGGIGSVADLLKFVSLLQSDSMPRTVAAVAGDDLLLIFDVKNNGVATDGVRLDGIVGNGGLDVADLYDAGAIDASAVHTASWDFF